jgi:hypothetical protein
VYETINVMKSHSRVSQEVRLLALITLATVGASSGLAITLMGALSFGRILSVIFVILLLAFVYWQLRNTLKSARRYSVRTDVLLTVVFLAVAGCLEWLTVRSLAGSIALRFLLVQAVLLVVALVLALVTVRERAG